MWTNSSAPQWRLTCPENFTNSNTNSKPFLTLTPAPDGLGSLRLAQIQGINKTAVGLGINPNMLGRWKREFETSNSQGRPAFTGRGVIALSEQEQEIQRLRKELEIARLLDPKMHLRAGSQERDILKKAVTCLDHTAAPMGLVASSPRKASEIQIHSRAPRRIQPRDHAARARSE